VKLCRWPFEVKFTFTHLIITKHSRVAHMPEIIKSGRSVKLITYFNLVPRSIMHKILFTSPFFTPAGLYEGGRWMEMIQDRVLWIIISNRPYHSSEA
jgi:hypothetical protein